jgi:hypothetical protein
MTDHHHKIEIMPSAPVMEDVSLDDDPEVALAPAVPIIATPACCTAHPPQHAVGTPNSALPAQSFTPVYPNFVGSPAGDPFVIVEPRPVPITSAVAPVPQYTVSNDDYSNKMKRYRNQVACQRTVVWIASGILLIVVLVVGIVMITRQRNEINRSWDTHDDNSK